MKPSIKRQANIRIERKHRYMVFPKNILKAIKIVGRRRRREGGEGIKEEEGETKSRQRDTKYRKLKEKKNGKATVHRGGV